MTNLKELQISSGRITVAGLAQPKDLSKLQTLRLYSTRVTDAGVQELQKALPKVKIVRGNSD